jgi:serine/threonine protein kinase
MVTTFPQQARSAPSLLPAFAGGRYRANAIVSAVQRYSTVYRGVDTATGESVAIKEMKWSGLTPVERRLAETLFCREAALLGDLDHPGIARLRDAGCERGRRYLVLDFIEGTTLEEYADQVLAPGRSLPLGEVLSLGIELCAILSYLQHTCTPALIHRDIKPSNVILGLDGRVHLIDFSIARRSRGQQGSRLVPLPITAQCWRDTIVNVGSRGYAAREQYGGQAATTPQADIYSLGATLHHLLSGQDPSKKPIAQLFTFAALDLHGLPAGERIAALIARMTDENPLSRPDVAEVQATLACCKDLSSAESGAAILAGRAPSPCLSRR